jgi:hypothetical protein
MRVGTCKAPIPRQPLGILRHHQPVRDKVGEHTLERQFEVMPGYRSSGPHQRCRTMDCL